jgi:hypothetical protein
MTLIILNQHHQNYFFFINSIKQEMINIRPTLFDKSQLYLPLAKTQAKANCPKVHYFFSANSFKEAKS